LRTAAGSDIVRAHPGIARAKKIIFFGEEGTEGQAPHSERLAFHLTRRFRSVTCPPAIGLESSEHGAPNVPSPGQSDHAHTVDIDLPVLLEQPAPCLSAYPYETVIAEKFRAMVALGRANTRLKDFYDIWVLDRSHTFDEDRLARAIAATFARRKTEIPVEAPDALTAAFAADPAKQRQWAAFVGDVAIDPGSLAEVTEQLAAFLMPYAAKARSLRSAQATIS
jgi:hypothetical protein